jgi:hypothetical protein
VRKYGNIPTVVDGQTFASKKEARRYGDLKLLEKAGEIRKLEVQPRFPLKVNGKLVCTYVGDFSYVTDADQYVVEDVKGPVTRTNPVYRIKVKLLEACLNVQVREV